MSHRSGSASLPSVAVVLWLAMPALCSFSPAAAAAPLELYTVSVPLDPQNPQARDDADREALRRVLIRVTGSSDETQLQQLEQIFADPEHYVLRYRSGDNNTLQVSFDGDAIKRLLRQSRHAVWGGDRPLTLVWLAVDWGQGEREIVAADDALQSPDATRSIDRNRLLRERVEEIADLRGIPVVFPLLDAEDLENVSFSDIWGRFDDRLLSASQRYDATSVLVGRVRPATPQRNRWTYYFGDEQLTWSGEPEQVVNLLADELAAQFAIRGNAVLETYGLTVAGVDSVIAYGEVQRLMDGLGVVEDFRLRGAAGRKLEYRVRVYGGIERLRKALELSGFLQPSDIVETDDTGRIVLPDPNTLLFEYRPPPVTSQRRP